MAEIFACSLCQRGAFRDASGKCVGVLDDGIYTHFACAPASPIAKSRAPSVTFSPLSSPDIRAPSVTFSPLSSPDIRASSVTFSPLSSPKIRAYDKENYDNSRAPRAHFAPDKIEDYERDALLGPASIKSWIAKRRRNP